MITSPFFTMPLRYRVLVDNTDYMRTRKYFEPWWRKPQQSSALAKKANCWLPLASERRSMTHSCSSSLSNAQPTATPWTSSNGENSTITGMSCALFGVPCSSRLTDMSTDTKEEAYLHCSSYQVNSKMTIITIRYDYRSSLTA